VTSVPVPVAALEYKLSPLELALYVDLLYLAGDSGRSFCLSWDAVASRRRVSRNTARRAADNLVRFGLLEVRAETKTANGASAPPEFKPLPPKGKAVEPRPVPAPPAGSEDPLALSTARTMAKDALWKSGKGEAEIEALTEALDNCRTRAEVQAVVERMRG